MAVYKCKMCGASLNINDNETVAFCAYCGTQQTLPKLDDETTKPLFNRANSLRLKNEFDKAQELYEKIISTGSLDAEAYWGIVLCKFGVEYVEDPVTFKRVPTCHRTQLESVLSDVDYKAAIENADMFQKTIYEAEAKAIDELQKNILRIVDGEEPFDVFICYKESDENGKRTQDSVLANDIYHLLTQEGIKVFYAAITLEDKLGQEFEPYIFAALNSAKVMLVIGTKPEYFNAVWVRNEWGRFLKIIRNDKRKVLIPCYKDMDAYGLPEEFSHLQAQDMSKLGFMQDLTRGIKKITQPNNIGIANTGKSTGNPQDNSKREIAYDDGYYIGEAIADQPNGYGVRVWSNNNRYEGMWKFGKFNGQGNLYFANGDKFEGEFKDGEPYNGYGRKNYSDGYFVGRFVNGKREGKGNFTANNGDTFEGEYKADEKCGQGIYRYANGASFKGEYRNNKPYNGYGAVKRADGYYKGGVANGVYEGQGVLVLKNGDRYEGEYKSGKQNGRGTYYYANGDKFIGVFRDDRPFTGNGRLTFSDGSYFIGQIENGQRKGKGEVYLSNGEKFQPESRVSVQDGRVRVRGCYVATAVYGSYDCPEVWILRRYRDYTLAGTWYGRAFIRAYYATSPTLVKWFGHTKWFRKMWQRILDRLVKKLSSKGYESTPYEDNDW